MQLSEEKIRKIAHLARLQVTKDEITHLQKSVTNILEWVHQLESVPTEGVTPLASVHLEKMPERSDKVTAGGIANDILANSPEAEHDMFVVPKVVE